jgi:hypothetical protein
MESPMDRTLTGQNPKMERGTNSRKETEPKTETGMEVGMETETRIRETSSAIRTNSVVDTAGTSNLSGRTERVRGVVYVTQPAPKEMRGEAGSAEQKRRRGLLFIEREERSPHFPLLW